MDLASRFEHVLKEKKVSSYRLSILTGLAQSNFSDIKNGKNKNPSLEILTRISKALKITVSELIGEAEERYSGKVKELADMANHLNPTQLQSLIFLAQTFLEVHEETSATSLKREIKMGT